MLWREGRCGEDGSIDGHYTGETLHRIVKHVKLLVVNFRLD